MKKLKTATLNECLAAGDWELSAFARRQLGDADMPMSKPAGEKGGKPRMSSAAIMDLYRSGDALLAEKAREQAVYAYSAYVRSIISRSFPTFEKAYGEDLYECGIIGLLKALDGYREGFAFTTYSRRYILHEMAAFTYNIQGNPNAYCAKIQKSVKNAVMALEADGCEITPEQVSRMTGIHPDIARREMAVLRRLEFVYLDEFEHQELFGVADPAEDAAVENATFEAAIKLIRGFSPEDRELLRLRIGEELSFSQISRMSGMDPRKVKQRYDCLIRRLRRKLS